MRADPAGRIASALVRRGLAAPARLLVDAHRPLAPLLSDVGAALGPLMAAVAGPAADDVRQLVDDAEGLDRLVESLDEAVRTDVGAG
jgi:hypothetical protein